MSVANAGLDSSSLAGHQSYMPIHCLSAWRLGTLGCAAAMSALAYVDLILFYCVLATRRLFLENLLGTECQMSVTRLKRRVGLLPPIRPSRPYVGTGPGYQNETAAATQELHSSAAEAQAVLS